MVCEEGKEWLDEIGKRLIDETGEKKVRCHLMQRISMAILKGNAAYIISAWPSNKEIRLNILFETIFALLKKVIIKLLYLFLILCCVAIMFIQLKFLKTIEIRGCILEAFTFQYLYFVFNNIQICFTSTIKFSIGRH